MTKALNGLIAAVHTPFDPECRLNTDMVETQAKHLQRCGVQGVFLGGTTGEGLLLSSEERLELLRAWKTAVAQLDWSSCKVIFHVSHASQVESMNLARAANEIGVDGISSVGPIFFSSRDLHDLVDFCADIGGAAEQTPFYFYYMPSLTHMVISVHEFLGLADSAVPSLRGVKFTSENLIDYALCLHDYEGRFDMVFGRDELLLCALQLGAQAAIGSTYNFAAPLYCRLIDAYRAGRHGEALDLQLTSMRMIHLARQFPVPDLVVGKAMMKSVGVDCGPVRPPLHNLSEVDYACLLGELEALHMGTHMQPCPGVV